MALTPPPVVPGFTGNAPNRNNPGSFSADMDTYLGEMQPNVDGENLLADWMNSEAVPEVQSIANAAQTSADDSAASAGQSATSALEALTSENEAEASALSAANSANQAAVDFVASSTTSLLIGFGSKTFAIETGKGFVIGQGLKAASSADVNNEMSGEVTAASDGSITINITQFSGSGTYADWSISLSSLPINDSSTTTVEAWSGSKVQTELNLKANKDNAALTGIPTAPTAALGTNTGQIATTEFVESAVDASPSGIELVSTTVIPSAVAFIDIPIPSNGSYMLTIDGLSTDAIGGTQLLLSSVVSGSEVTSGYNSYAFGVTDASSSVLTQSSSNLIRLNTSLVIHENCSADLFLDVDSSSASIQGTIIISSNSAYTALGRNPNNGADAIRIKTSNSRQITGGKITLRKYA